MNEINVFFFVIECILEVVIWLLWVMFSFDYIATNQKQQLLVF